MKGLIISCFWGVIVLFSSFFSSCKKDDLFCSTILDSRKMMALEWQTPECHGEFEPNPINYYVEEYGNQYKFPVFSPDNPYEFIFYKVTMEGIIETNHQIFKYNLETGVQTLLLDQTEIDNIPAWNRKGYIAYKNRSDATVHLRNPVDGTADQIFGYTNSIPGFGGDNLIWFKGGDTLYWGGIDINGMSYLRYKGIGDSIHKGYSGSPISFFGEFTISKKGLLLGRGSNNIFPYVDLNKGIMDWYSYMFPNIEFNYYGRTNWNADGDRFYVSGNRLGQVLGGFYEYTTSTREIKKLLDVCQKQYIYQGVCSPNGRFLILQKVEREPYPIPDDPFQVNIIFEQSTLWVYDLETGKEAKIPIE